MLGSRSRSWSAYDAIDNPSVPSRSTSRSVSVGMVFTRLVLSYRFCVMVSTVTVYYYDAGATLASMAASISSRFTDIRRRLHRCPEPAWREFRTTAVLVEELRTIG